MSTCSRRTYDHRIKQQIAKAGNPELFPELEIPRSTVRSWIRRGMGSVVSLDPDLGAEAALRFRIVLLERRTAVLIRRYGWRRPRLRLYPPKPKVGVRAVAPNVAWHVDVTIIKLLDGTKAHLHAVIDNFSRRILAWTIADRLEPMNTRDVLVRAASNLERPMTAEVYLDSGAENLNDSVDDLFLDGALRRVIAQIDVSLSNSMLESWWHSLKHQWLCLHQLDNIATVRKLVDFYVTEHNQRMPHSAFDGQTPDEMYFGRGARAPDDPWTTLGSTRRGKSQKWDERAARRQEARKRRLEHNRQQACDRCSRQHEEDVAA